MEKGSLLFYVSINTHFIEMFQLARIVKNEMTEEPVIFFTTPYNKIELDIEKCKCAGIAYVFLNQKVVKVGRKTARYRYLKQIITFFHSILLTLNSSVKNSKLAVQKAIIYVKGLVNSEVRHLNLRLLKRLIKVSFYMFYPAWLIILFVNLIGQKVFGLLLFMLKSQRIKTSSALSHHLLLAISVLKFNISIKHCLKREFVARRVQALILPEESFYYGTTTAISLANKKNIKTFIYPFSIYNETELYQGFRNNRDFTNPVLPKFLYRLVFSKWVNDNNAVTLFVPLYYAVLQFLKGSSPRLPWVPNSQPVNQVLLDSDQIVNYYVESKIPADRISVIGHPSDDLAAQAMQDREAYLASHIPHFEGDRQRSIFCVALPPNQVERWIEVDCGFDNYDQFIDYLLRLLRKVAERYEVIIKPHPRTEEKHIHLCELEGFVITHTDIGPLISVSDSFLAFASATIRLTARAHTPTINYDVYDYGYTDFDLFENVKKVSNKADFETVMNKLVEVDSKRVPYRLQPRQTERFSEKFSKVLREK